MPIPGFCADEKMDRSINVADAIVLVIELRSENIF
jgi:hypothetical protein